MFISNEDIKQFSEDGALVLRNVFRESEGQGPVCCCSPFILQLRLGGDCKERHRGQLGQAQQVLGEAGRAGGSGESVGTHSV